MNDIETLLSHIQLPTRVYLRESEAKTPYGNVHFAKVSLEPLQPGYGYTLGNSMRRLLLSSVPGYAVCGVEIEGISHELQTIDGVHEDVLNILMNLKQLVFRLNSGTDHAVLELSVQGPGKATAADIRGAGLEVVNPDLVIAHLNAKVSLKMRIFVRLGLGYVASSQQTYDEFAPLPVDFLRMDSVYSPVINASYQVHGARVNQRTDYDRLVLSIQTNGAVEPKDALSAASHIMVQQMRVFGDLEKNITPDAKLNSGDEELRLLQRPVAELELGVRALNCLQSMNIETLEQLVSYSEKELLKTPNLGRKSLDQIQVLLAQMGLSLRPDA